MKWLKRLGKVVLGFTHLCVLGVIFVFVAYFTFNHTVQSGVTAVPDLAGLTLEEAGLVLGELGLLAAHDPRDDRFSLETEPGRVFRQAPQKGKAVKRGAKVRITLSRGQQMVVIPDVSGRALPAAQVQISASGLEIGRVLRIHSRTGREGTVVLQHPRAGGELLQGAPVDLYLSERVQNSTYVMPDLVNRDYERIRRSFEGMGLRVGSVKFEVYEGIPSGIVLRQFPLAGHPVRRSDAISLVVSSLPETPGAPLP